MLLVGPFPHQLSEVIPYFLKVFSNPYVLGAVLSLIVAGLAWVSTISRAEALSRVYPFMALSYVLVVIFSALVFRENVTF